MTEKKYYVNFGPELLELLGPNLYTNVYFVLGELIANAYDADAKNVYIYYSNKRNDIIVEDDGIGMSYNDMINRYLSIGTKTRKSSEDERTPVFNRKRMGRKGIGKLSALTISESVEVRSIKEGEKSGCVLTVNNIKQNDDGKFEIPAIDDENISFINIKSNGTSVKMINSRFNLAKDIR